MKKLLLGAMLLGLALVVPVPSMAEVEYKYRNSASAAAHIISGAAGCGSAARYGRRVR